MSTSAPNPADTPSPEHHPAPEQGAPAIAPPLTRDQRIHADINASRASFDATINTTWSLIKTTLLIIVSVFIACAVYIKADDHNKFKERLKHVKDQNNTLYECTKDIYKLNEIRSITKTAIHNVNNKNYESAKRQFNNLCYTEYPHLQSLNDESSILRPKYFISSKIVQLDKNDYISRLILNRIPHKDDKYQHTIPLDTYYYKKFNVALKPYIHEIINNETASETLKQLITNEYIDYIFDNEITIEIDKLTLFAQNITDTTEKLIKSIQEKEKENTSQLEEYFTTLDDKSNTTYTLRAIMTAVIALLSIAFYSEIRIITNTIKERHATYTMLLSLKYTTQGQRPTDPDPQPDMPSAVAQAAADLAHTGKE